ncbi:hypothetical protein IW140_003729 [Coemansia sp. RSA 1813]|nr:hypothetical protein EV178_003694 [Coemansia sp. RSA 1646]KAJ1768874.1 hypothetical protein LPJ74_004518 [Coemansia sp. RSA 1843]KAJ2088733.1 hypothetical protein IW138_004005 [Coemansia sp. RSA 986]KAJ2213648.1 hypothetical protein EV179_003648 [Coemansia sp. RSA 487]KAJ2568635.1 hypothetical protein IW140_003729 [Coemansia sp. RSA 1813]
MEPKSSSMASATSQKSCSDNKYGGLQLALKARPKGAPVKSRPQQEPLYMFVKIPRLLHGSSTLTILRDHIKTVTKALPTSIYFEPSKERWAICCATESQMNQLEEHPFLWEGIHHAWRTAAGNATYRLLVVPEQVILLEELQSAFAGIGKVVVDLAPVCVQRVRTENYTCTLEFSDSKEPPNEITIHGRTIAKVYNAYTCKICSVCTGVTRHTCVCSSKYSLVEFD